MDKHPTSLEEVAAPLAGGTVEDAGVARVRCLVPITVRLLNWTRTALKTIARTGLTLSAAVTLVLIGVLFFEALFNKATTIQSLSVPKSLADNGFGPEVASARLRDEIKEKITGANTSLRSHDVLEQTEVPDVVIPGVGLSVQTLANDVSKFLGLKPKGFDISGEFTIEGGNLSLRLRANGNQFFTTPGVDPRVLDNLLGDAAEAVLHKTQPYVLASYLYGINKDAALAEANWIIANFPASDEQVSRSHYLKGRILANDLQHEAMGEYKAAIALDPKFAYPHNGLGTVLNALGRRDQAIAEYKAAIAIAPEYAYPHSGLGDTLNALGRRDEAIAQYKAAIALDRKYADPHNGLGTVLDALGRRDEAIAEYETAIKLDPKDTRPRANLGMPSAYSGPSPGRSS